MHKDFDRWNNKKKDIHNKQRPLDYNEREIWWCKLGVNVGDEQDGTNAEFERPVLILKGVSRNTCYVVPLTTSAQEHKYRISIGDVDGREAKVIISQIRLIDTRRLVNKVRFLDKELFREIRKTARNLF